MSDKHNTLKLQINSRLGHNFSFYLPYPFLLPYRKSLIVTSTTNLAGFEWMIKHLQKQKQIGKAMFHSTFQFTTTCQNHNNTASKAKLRTVTFCSCKSFTCPPDLFLSCSRWPVVQRLTRSNGKQSRASIIKRSTIHRANTCPFLRASANAGPHYQKFYARATHIWGNRKFQPDPGAMKGPRLERTASLITEPPASG